MTLREMFPEWWCKVTFSVPENCSWDYNWLDFSIYEFIFAVVIVLVIKWVLYCLFFIIGLIIPDKTVDATIISPSLLEKEMDIPNDEIEDIKGKDLEFDEDVFGLEDESKIIKCIIHFITNSITTEKIKSYNEKSKKL